MSKQRLRVNEQIRVRTVRLVDQDNQQVGIIDTREALERAREASLDLVEVAPNSEPPVCRIMDYGKWLYEQKRKQKQNLKKQHAVTLKEIRLRPKIDEHDRQIKLNRAIKFFEKGHRVQFTMLFRGREMIHLDHGLEMLNQIAEELAEYAHLESPARRMGRRMNIVMAPNKPK